MARDDLVQFDGQVENATGGGIYQVLLENGVKISAKLCGRMKRYKIRVVIGDRVTVGVSPYDLTHGLIVHRHRT